MKPKTKILMWGAAFTALATAAGIGGYKYIHHTPPPAYNPSWRALYRADGTPKKAFDTPEEANIQTLKQLFRHGEICTSYTFLGKYFTGHPRGWIKSINPLKNFKKSA